MPDTDDARVLTPLRNARWAVVFAVVAFLSPPLIYLTVEGASVVATALLTAVMWPLAVWFCVYAVRASTSMSSTALMQQFAFTRKVTDLRTIDGVELASRGAGDLVLRLMRGSERAAVLQVMLKTDYVKASLPPAELDYIADVLASRLGQPTEGLQILRAQARHLEGGGDIETSPFVPLISRGAARLGKAGAIGASGSNLLG